MDVNRAPQVTDVYIAKSCNIIEGRAQPENNPNPRPVDSLLINARSAKTYSTALPAPLNLFHHADLLSVLILLLPYWLFSAQSLARTSILCYTSIWRLWMSPDFRVTKGGPFVRPFYKW